MLVYFFKIDKYLCNKPNIPDNLKPIIKKLEKIGQVHNYFFKFHWKNKYELKDIDYDNAVIDIHNTYKHLKKYIMISINHACPYGLIYCDKYPKYVKAIICYPYRFYCKESYERRIWKFKNNKGWKFSHSFDDYILNINKKRFDSLFTDINDEKKEILYFIFDFNLQKHYYKIPTKFKVPTVLFTILDLDTQSIIKYNYDRKDVRAMKKIKDKDSALFNSAIWNFDRVKYDALLKEQNKNNNKLTIKYIISGWEDFNDIVDQVNLLLIN